jgi:deazaflavin-dependent oxidoreductase (nitroreductase family)
MVPSDFFLKVMNLAHRVVLKLSGGRLGWKAMKMPVIELTTTGRRSGEPRSVMLTSPVQEGDTVVIVASRGGGDNHPAWFLNLEAKPEVEVRYQGKKPQPMVATVADEAARTRLWPRIVEAYKGYADYQTRTDREIPVVLLTPAPAASAAPGQEAAGPAGPEGAAGPSAGEPA